MCQCGNKPLKPSPSQEQEVPELWRTETSAERFLTFPSGVVPTECLPDVTTQEAPLLLNPDDQTQSVHLPLLPFPRSGSYLLWSRCSPRWLRCLVSSGTEPSPRLIAELVEMTHNARIYVNELMRGEQRSTVTWLRWSEINDVRRDRNIFIKKKIWACFSFYVRNKPRGSNWQTATSERDFLWSIRLSVIKAEELSEPTPTAASSLFYYCLF